MKNYSLMFSLLIFGSLMIHSQSPIGIWETRDDQSGNLESWIEIYQKGDQFFGKVVKIFHRNQNEVCKACDGENKNQPILGMEVLSGLKSYRDYWKGGEIIYPKNGNTYSCYIKLKNPNEIHIRGYIGYPFLGKTQVWRRVDT